MKKNYIKSPAQKLTENQIDIAQATLDAESNGLVQGLNMFGSLASGVGSGLISKGLANGETGFLADNAKDLEALLGILGAANSTFAYGGTVVEVEGNEVAETPSGKVLKFKGPKHEKGGIKTELPGGTEVFSDRIKIDDETLAKRKLKREKKEKKFSGSDNISKNTLNRVKKSNDLQESEDKQLQDLIRLIGEENINKFAVGGTVPNIKDFITMLQGGISLNPLQTPSLATPSINPSVSNKTTGGNISNLPSLTLGDALGMFGNIYQANSAYKNTLANRASDTPNINPYENFGSDALETNNEAKGLATQIRDKQLQDLEMNRSTLSTRNRQGARGINTMRALDLAGSIAANQGEADIQANYASQLLGLLQQESQLENMRDNAVMSGEAQRDLADRQDKDNFYTNKGANLTDIGRAISQTGRSLNDIKSRDTQGNLVNQLFDYLNFDPLTGTISQKDNVNLVGDSTQVQFTNFENQEGYKSINNPQTNKPFTKTEWNKLNSTEKMNLFTRYKIK